MLKTNKNQFTEIRKPVAWNSRGKVMKEVAVALHIKRNIPEQHELWYAFNRKERRARSFSLNDDGSVQVTNNVRTEPKTAQYKATDFVNHYQRKNKSILQNTDYWIGKVLAAEEHKVYKKKRGWK